MAAQEKTTDEQYAGYLLFVRYFSVMAMAVEELPNSVSFSEVENRGRINNDRGVFRSGFDEDSEYYERENDPLSEAMAREDTGLERPFEEQALLNILKTLPSDRYRCIALLLFLRDLGYSFRYEDIGAIWGNKKVSVFNTIARMKKSLVKAGINPNP